MQQTLIGRCNAKQRVIVGDPCQAIYAWRGAASSAMANAMQAWDLREMPLTISFRCPKSVVREAQRWVSHITSGDSAPEGLVQTLDSYSPETFRDGAAVICRYNRPLFQFAFWALKNRIKVTMKGNDMLEVLLRLFGKFGKQVENREQLAHMVEAYFAQKIAAAKSDQARASYSERMDCSLFILSEIDPRVGPGEIADSLRQMFEGRTGLELSTIHKAKGMEWRQVFLLDFDEFPRSNAKPGPLLDQEYNMKYVAVTRAKEELNFIRSVGR
jgi:superfamily I DNA/RNA helicase